MADAKFFGINGENYPILDQTARDASAQALAEAEFSRQDSLGIYPGRDIATILAGEVAGSSDVFTVLHQRAQAGDYSMLRAGDYITVEIAGRPNVLQQERRYQLGGVDLQYGANDQAPGEGHTLMFVPEAPIEVTGTKAVNGSYLPWNTTNNNNGSAKNKCPYMVSNLHKWEIEDFLPALPQKLQDVLVNRRALLEHRFASGQTLTDSGSWSWQDMGKVWSLSEIEVYGCLVWAGPYAAGFDCQLPLFKSTKWRLRGTRVNWWLRSVQAGSSSTACNVSSDGYAASGVATNDWIRPAPGFLIG